MKKTFRLFFFAVLILSLSVSSWTATQQKQQPQPRPEPPPVTAHQVKGNIYEVKGGSGANSGFFIGENEVLVIDAKMNEKSAKQIIEEIKKLTANPIKHIVLTHSDGDHVNGLFAFPDKTNIISHHQTRKHMDQAFDEPSQKSYLPNQTFSEKLKLYAGNKLIKLLHFGPAHTDGDVIVYFPEEKVAFLGDLLFLGRDPLIHRHKNGNSFGLIKALKGILKLDADTFVHGHGDIVGKSEIEGLINTLEEKQVKIKALIQEGKSLDEIKKAFDVQDLPARSGRSRRPSLVEVIYLELTEK